MIPASCMLKHRSARESRPADLCAVRRHNSDTGIVATPPRLVDDEQTAQVAGGHDAERDRRFRRRP